MDISRLDLNLIVTLDVLLAEQNITHAARRLNLSQPALSARLKRLRKLFADPLLVPAQRGMVPTQRALELQGPLHDALEGVRQVVAEAAPFDPSTVVATAAICGSDYVQHSVLMPLIRSVASEAPGLRFAWRTLDVAALAAQMERGEIDLALVTPESAPPSSRMIKLYHERYVVIARKHHPRVLGSLDLDLFCKLQHVIVSPRGGGFEGATDLILEAAGLRRRVALSAAAFLIVPEVIAGSDMIAVVPDRLVRGHPGRLQVLEPPIGIPGFDIAMVWHDRNTTHPIQRWLRERIVRVSRGKSG